MISLLIDQLNLELFKGRFREQGFSTLLSCQKDLGKYLVNLQSCVRCVFPLNNALPLERKTAIISEFAQIHNLVRLTVKSVHVNVLEVGWQQVTWLEGFIFILPCFKKEGRLSRC